MISVQQASDIVLKHLFDPVVKRVPLTEAQGFVLAEPIVADRDLPPFDRATMDGIAIRFEVWQKGKTQFDIEAIQSAGQARKSLNKPDAAIEIMTGAMLPAGTDTVVRYEDILMERPVAAIKATSIERYQSIHRQGADAKKGEMLLDEGVLLSPSEIAVLASVGKSEVLVRSFPRTALVSTGDELVDVGHAPLDHQIRRSNTYALASAMKELNWSSDLFHFPDNEDILRTELSLLLEKYDVVILSGGVSAGKFDFIPKVLQMLGVTQHFHQVAQRPGKPVWFGTAKRNVVFALPGNPVSTFMCFYRYIRPWALKSLGTSSRQLTAVLAKDFSFQPHLTYFLQVQVRIEKGRVMAFPITGGGSGDFVNLKQVDGFLELPAGAHEFKAGEVFDFIPFRLSKIG